MTTPRNSRCVASTASVSVWDTNRMNGNRVSLRPMFPKSMAGGSRDRHATVGASSSDRGWRVLHRARALEGSPGSAPARPTRATRACDRLFVDDPEPNAEANQLTGKRKTGRLAPTTRTWTSLESMKITRHVVAHVQRFSPCSDLWRTASRRSAQRIAQLERIAPFVMTLSVASRQMSPRFHGEGRYAVMPANEHMLAADSRIWPTARIPRHRTNPLKARCNAEGSSPIVWRLSMYGAACVLARSPAT